MYFSLYTYQFARYSLGVMTLGTVFCNQCGEQNSTTAQFCSKCGAALSGALPITNRAVASDATLTAPQQTQYTPAVISAPSMITTTAGYGGFWIRFVAAVIDGIVVQAVVMPVAFIGGLAIGAASAAMSSFGQGANFAAIMIAGVFGFFGSWLYEAAMESSTKQATLGKMVFGLRVTDFQGNRISFARATGRHFSKYLSGMILCLGYVMAGFTDRKQALHDMIAGTLVRRA
jgi:uncharacterized RDD family membrane protein YckC